MGILIFYILFSSFLFGIMVFVFKKVSKAHTEVNTYNFGSTINNENQEKLRQRDITINIIIYSLLILVAIVGTILYQTKNSEKEDFFLNYLFNGLQFQIMSSLLFIVLSFLNPFIFFPQKIVEAIKERESFLIHIVNNSRKSFVIRVLVSVFVIAFFVLKKWLTFIPYYVDYKFLQGINILLLLYLFKNIYFMKTNPLGFLQLNILRLLNGVLYVKIFAFVLIPLAPFTMLTIHLLGFDENAFPFWTMLFVVFNALLILLELKKKNKKEVEKMKSKKKKKNKKLLE